MDVYGRRYAFGNDFTTPDGKPYSLTCRDSENFELFSQKVTKLEQAEDALRKAIQSKYRLSPSYRQQQVSLFRRMRDRVVGCTCTALYR